jgi:hypothetical protein
MEKAIVELQALFFFIFANTAGPSILPGLRHGKVEVPPSNGSRLNTDIT